MHVIAKKALRDHWEKPGREDSEGPLKAWYAEAENAEWKTPADIKSKYRNASFAADKRVVFNIAGNKYRLVVHVNYPVGIVRVKFVGTHDEYDEIDVTTVGGGARS
jgi:mRNA interferase HigB